MMISDSSARSLPEAIDTESPLKPTRRYRKSRVYALKRAVRELGSRTIDRRTRVGKALAAWCEDLAGDLGGVDQLSTAQKAIIEQAATTRLLLDSIDAWLVQQSSLVDKRRRALLPVVRERQSLADALVRYLTALGLGRKSRDVTDLASYLAERISSDHGRTAASLVEQPRSESTTSRHEPTWHPSESETPTAQPGSAMSRRDEVLP
jgi:hypothetical protein